MKTPMDWTLKGIDRLFVKPGELDAALESFGAQTEAADTDAQAALALERRRLRMKAAGALFPAAVESAMTHIGRPPVVAGNQVSAVLAEATRRFMASKEQLSLVLSAPAGRGKSWLATWAVAETRDRSLWLPAADVRVGETWEALRVKALKVALLVVDDLGEETSGEWGSREIAAVLEGRHNAGKRSMVTTNLMPDAMGNRYGERLLSRWSQEGVSRIVCVRGVDLRRSAP